MTSDERRCRLDIPVAEAELPKLVERAECGEEILICRTSIPVAKLVPLPDAFDADRQLAWEGEILLDEGLEELLYASAEA